MSDSYLARYAFRRLIMSARGLALFRRSFPVFVGGGVSFRSRRKIRVGRGVTLDNHSYVDAESLEGVFLGSGSTVGRNTRIECVGSLATLGVGLSVGTNVGLGTDCFYGCAGGVTIGADTIVGNFVSFHSENHESSDTRRPIRLQGVTHLGIEIGQDCWIGARVTVLDGVVLGHGSIVAAGAVLTAGTYPPYGVYGGVPARLISMRKATGEETR